MSRGSAQIIGVIPRYSKHSKHNIYANTRMPPAGIVSVFSQLTGDPRFKNAYIIDENNYRGPNDFTGMPDHVFLQKRAPALIAMLYGGMTNSIDRMYSVAQQYKKFKAVTIAGGSHVDALPEEALNSGIDIVVHGEGEFAAREILESIVGNDGVHLNPDRLSRVKGISFLDGQKHIFTGKRDPIDDLDSLLDVDITLVKYLKKRWSALPVSRGRGCNWKCEFCSVNKLYGPHKSASSDSVLRQIVTGSDLGYKRFFFTDDNFSQNTFDTIDLCKKIGDYKMAFRRKIDLVVQVRSEIAGNDLLIDAMKFAGVSTLAIGFESAINEELLAMNKKVTVEDLLVRSRKLSEHFYLHGMFIFGYPFEEYKSSLTLVERAKLYQKFFRDARIDTVQVLNAIPIPGSDLRNRLSNRILPLETVGYDKYDGLFLCYDPRPEGLDPFDLQNLPKVLMKKYYVGNFMNRRLNKANWMTWSYTAGSFPAQFLGFYAKRFVHNLLDKRRSQGMEDDLVRGGVFKTTLVDAWDSVKAPWRTLYVKTRARGIVKKWTREYEKSDFLEKFRGYFSKKE